jgi:hypothetical protein
MEGEREEKKRGMRPERTFTAATACMKLSSLQVHTLGKRSRSRRWPCSASTNRF